MAVRKTFHKRVYWGIIRRQGALCGECGLRLSGEYQFDHILPLWLGGKDEPENLQAVHEGCHKLKTAQEATNRAKMRRIQEKHGRRQKTRPRGHHRNRLGSDKWKRKVDGTVVRR